VASINVIAGAVIQKLSPSALQINRSVYARPEKRAALGCRQWLLDRCRCASRTEVKRLRVSENCEGTLVTPDGGRAYVASESGNFVAVIDLHKLELTGRIQPGSGPDGMAWVVKN
jgi:hypothetical protein